MNKYAFNHDANTTPEALGISDERIDFINESVMSIAVRAMITDKEINSASKALERLINDAQPASKVEAMLIGYLFGKAELKVHEVAKKIHKSLP